ncbi:torso-like protein [Ischnura elegans]|uniref:torso-like protein n=1 Tax=Ischnura elegans TaxID=197161 RepID=UPI001ED8AFED|nr:torso-like protein [Ischnura elegans]
MAVKTHRHRSILLVFILSALVAVPLRASGSQLPNRIDVSSGRSINVFRKYGSLVQTIKVTPVHNDVSDSAWIFKEPAQEVFVKVHPAREINKPPEEDISGWEFRMSFCNSIEDVMREYFRHFSIDGHTEAWKVFAGMWERRDMARHLGIEESFAEGEHRYVFVSISRNRSAGKWYVKGLSVLGRFLTTEEPAFNRRVSEATETIIPGDKASVQRFFRRYGTHYIASYATGESLYQVFVYDHSVHRNFEEIMIRRGMGNFKLRIVSTILSPLFAVHLGKVQVASGNATLREWVEENLEDHVMSVPHSTILKCFRNADLRRRLEGVMSDGVFLRLELRSIGPSIRSKERREWFEEVLRNRLALWDANV